MEKRFKVLLATDYSELTISAENYAINLAKSINATLTILHVYSIPLVATPPEPYEFAKTRQEFRDAEIKRLEQHKYELFRSMALNESAIDVECKVREGQVVKEICREAIEDEIDFIIVGTHGQSGFRNVILGSHTWHLIKRSNVPVFAIPPNQNFSRLRNIVYAVEDRKAEIDALNFVVDLGANFDADITLFHIATYSVNKKIEAEIFDNFKAEVKRNCSYDRIFFRFASYENVSQGLNDFALRTDADLVVMCPKRMAMIEKLINPAFSNTKKMSASTLLPLLAIPDNYAPAAHTASFLN